MNFDLVKELYINGQSLVKLEIANKIVWQKKVKPEPEIDENGPLTFVRIDNDGDGYIEIGYNDKTKEGIDKSFQYKINNGDWNNLSFYQKVYLNTDDVFQVKSTDINVGGNEAEPYGYGYNSNETIGAIHFITQGIYKCGGRVTSLVNDETDLSKLNYLYHDGYMPPTLKNRYAFSGLFYNTNITTPPNLKDITTLEYGCFVSMFWGCNHLTRTPDLLFTSITQRENYFGTMFAYCGNLTNVYCNALSFGEGNYEGWLAYTPDTGTFHANKNYIDSVRGASYVPENWTIINDLD